jgi:hypothetical protein
MLNLQLYCSRDRKLFLWVKNIFVFCSAGLCVFWWVRGWGWWIYKTSAAKFLILWWDFILILINVKYIRNMFIKTNLTNDSISLIWEIFTYSITLISYLDKFSIGPFSWNKWENRLRFKLRTSFTSKIRHVKELSNCIEYVKCAVLLLIVQASLKWKVIQISSSSFSKRHGRENPYTGYIDEGSK